MAKKTKRVKEDGKGNSFSTRLNAQQLSLIQQGARIAGVSPARLIREAALVRAADLVNADGAARAQLMRLGKLIVEQLVNPAAAYTEVHRMQGQAEFAEEMDREVSYRESRLICEIPDHPEEKFAEVKLGSVRPIRSKKRDLEQIKRALESCGSELVRMILDQWNNSESESEEYLPRVAAKSFLGGEVDEK